MFDVEEKKKKYKSGAGQVEEEHLQRAERGS